MRKTDSKKLETRDFISVGIFSLIYAVVAFVIGGVAQMTPVTFPFMPMIVALFTGTVFMLYVAKIPKKGALSILGVICDYAVCYGNVLDDVRILPGFRRDRGFYLRFR